MTDSVNNSNQTEDDRLLMIYTHPTLWEYYTNLTPFVILSMFVGSLIVVLNVSIFCSTVSKIRRRCDPSVQLASIVLCSLYPVICCAALVTIYLPKGWLVCHTVMHLSFTVGAVMLRQLCFRYVGSEQNYVKESDGVAVSINTPPCCCCCVCLPGLVPSKAKFSLLSCMVWQMPIVQGCIMLVLNLIYYMQKELYESVSLYFIPFLVCSILIGIWALNIAVRMVNATHSEYGLMRKMFCLQLILLLCKLQYMLLNSQLDNIPLGGFYPINHTIYKQTIINVLILVEMVLVSLLAQNAYKGPV
ncbi:organic solute transporter alpha-like protein [Stomoxys calcitrans]|uniref:Organic solute transporter alpha-like protein n=1 Tax=Stomoxys calcitrans TaxID=35570 RepID=A0A1I8P5E1_STOCA|nr:organic solute transporter alpha-like protein [Stomoxys calcitrans]XP_013119290.1 organic solute transporter alpha-like protein [Stomoxys calcitrans]